MDLTAHDQEYWDIKEVFHDQLSILVTEYQSELSTHYTSATVNKYTSVASAFIEYINDYTDHLSYESISVANANSKFIARAKYEHLYDWDSKEIKSKLRRFIEFLDEQGYHNPKVLKSLQKK